MPVAMLSEYIVSAAASLGGVGVSYPIAAVEIDFTIVFDDDDEVGVGSVVESDFSFSFSLSFDGDFASFGSSAVSSSLALRFSFELFFCN